MKLFRKNEADEKTDIAEIKESLNLILDLLTADSEEDEEKKEDDVEEKKEEVVEEEKENEVDKREDIDDVGGFLKSKGLDDEDIKYVMKLMEKNSYDNSCKKEDNEEEKKEIKKEIVENNIKKNSLSLKELQKEDIKKNSLKNDEGYLTREEKIKEFNKKFYVNK